MVMETKEEIKKEGFNEVSKDGATYYLAANAADIPENRFFVKSTHSKSFDDLQKDDELSFEANDPYLITYSHDTYLYEAGACITFGTTILHSRFLQTLTALDTILHMSR